MVVSTGGGPPRQLGEYSSKEQIVDLFLPESDEEHHTLGEDYGVTEALQLGNPEYNDRNERTRHRENTDAEDDRMRKRPRLSEHVRQCPLSAQDVLGDLPMQVDPCLSRDELAVNDSEQGGAQIRLRDKRRLVFDYVYVPPLRAFSRRPKSRESGANLCFKPDRLRRHHRLRQVSLPFVESSGDEGSMYETDTDCGSSEASAESFRPRTHTMNQRSGVRQSMAIHQKPDRARKYHRGERHERVGDRDRENLGTTTVQERDMGKMGALKSRTDTTQKLSGDNKIRERLDEGGLDTGGNILDSENAFLEDEQGEELGGMNKEHLAFLFDDEVDAELDNVEISEPPSPTPSPSDDNAVPHRHNKSQPTTSKNNSSFSFGHDGHADEPDGRRLEQEDIHHISDFEDNDRSSERIPLATHELIAPTTSGLLGQPAALCSYGGVGCPCTANDHRRDPALPAGSSLHVDRQCKVLSSLDLAFHLYHRFIICRPCDAFVPLGRLLAHMKSMHVEKLNGKDIRAKRRTRSFQVVIDHCVEVLDIPFNQEPTVFTKETFSGPIAGIQPPAPSVACPVCGRWYHGKDPFDTVRDHYNSSCRPQGSDPLDRNCKTLKSGWTQSPYKHVESKAGRVEVTSPVSAPATPLDSLPSKAHCIERFTVPTGVSSLCPRWAVEIGWGRWLNAEVSRGCTIQELRSFVALPAPIRGSKSKPGPEQPLSKKQHLYWASCRIRQRFIKMIEDANTFLSTANEELRTALTVGTKSQYREIKSEYQYSSFMLKNLLLFLRLEDCGDDTPRPAMPYSERQRKAIKELHSFVSSVRPPTNTDPCESYDLRLDELIHELSEALFYIKLPLSRAQTCATSLALFFLWLTTSGECAKSSMATHLCAIQQYWARTTVTHSLRLRFSKNEKYVPLSTRSTHHELNIDEELDADRQLKLLEDLRTFILPSNVGKFASTPFSLAKHFWRLAGIDARRERSLSKLAWEPNREAFEYSRPGISPVHITLSSLREMTHANEQDFLQQFRRLLPSTFCFSEVENLPWHTLRDDATLKSSFLDSEKPWEDWLCAAVNRMKDAYLDPAETKHRISAKGKPSLAAFNKFLDLDDKFQGISVGQMSSNNGATPRAVTMRDFNYRSDGRDGRHLFKILNYIALVGGRQKGESRRNGLREFVLRVFTPQSGNVLVWYLALIRRAIVEILTEQGWHTDSIEVYKTRILARRFSTGIWPVAEITKAWQKRSLPHIGAKLSIVDKRHIDTGIYCELFPSLIKVQEKDSSSRPENAVDAMADHGTAMGRRYGPSAEQPHGISGMETHHFIIACRVHQALMHLVPKDVHWPQDILESPVFREGRHEKFGIEVAHHLVSKEIRFWELGVDDAKTTVTSMCKNFPFIFSDNRQISLRNEIFRQVTSAVAWGEGSPGVCAVLPRGIDDAADAAALLLKVLDKFTDGCGTRRLDDTSNEILERYRSFRTFIHGKLTDFKLGNKEEWDEFERSVCTTEWEHPSAYLLSELNDVEMEEDT